MSLFQWIRGRVRSLMGERKQRLLPRRSAKPRIGAQIVHVEARVRLVVQAGMSDELWLWLLDRGWRVATVRPDRRRYRDIPGSWATLLIDSDPVSREQVLAKAIEEAEFRPTVGTRDTR